MRSDDDLVAFDAVQSGIDGDEADLRAGNGSTWIVDDELIVFGNAKERQVTENFLNEILLGKVNMERVSIETKIGLKSTFVK